MAAVSGSESDKLLAESLRRFCRSIELCDDYLRGYYGLKLATARLLQVAPQTSRPAKSDTLVAPDTKTIEKLNETATAKLSEIVRKSVGNEWKGYTQAEVIAAKALLEDSHAAPIVR